MVGDSNGSFIMLRILDENVVVFIRGQLQRCDASVRSCDPCCQVLIVEKCKTKALRAVRCKAKLVHPGTVQRDCRIVLRCTDPRRIAELNDIKIFVQLSSPGNGDSVFLQRFCDFKRIILLLIIDQCGIRFPQYFPAGILI